MTENGFSVLHYRPSQEHQGFLAAIDCFQRLHDREVERLTTKTPNDEV